MAPPSAAPQWVVLRRSPRTSMDLPEGADITPSLELAAPPRPSDLLVPPSLGVRGSRILAADPSGILLLFSPEDRLATATSEPASASYHLYDTLFKSISHVPLPDRPVDGDTCVAGLAISEKKGKQNVMIAELSVSDSVVTLRCFSMETFMWTTRKNLRPPPIKHKWCSSYAVYYRGRLWWVDLLQGLVGCDTFADTPELHFVPLPSWYRRSQRTARREGLSEDRCVSLSCEKLRLVVINRCTSQTRITLWTLADYEAGKWSLDFDVHIQDIWDHDSYRISGLPMERPVLAFVHPTNAHVVYFFLRQQLFAVDLQTAKVTESESSGRDDKHFLAWELPPSLRTSGLSPTQESRSIFDFDSVADSFCGAYGLALADTKFHQLSRVALAYLNRKKKPEDNMYTFSERLFLQTFEEDNDIRLKKYTHMNFYADIDSKKVLVFAEFHSDAVCDEDREVWTLSSCKTLTKSYHGGLYGEDADERRRKGAKKRKRSTYCFVCAPEILHPISGFEGGYPGFSAM